MDGGIVSDTLPIGSIVVWGSDYIPENWLLCDGSEISRTEYPDLFTFLGTKYGEGDGSTTFNLPNKKGRFAVGYDEEDTDFNSLGKTAGEKTHVLTIEEMPSHRHSFARTYGNIDYAMVDDGDSSTFGSPITQHTGYNAKSSEMNYTGGGKAHNNLPPYLVSNFIIKAKQTEATVAIVQDVLTSTSTTNALSANQGRVLQGRIEDNDNLIRTLQEDIINIEDTMITTIKRNGETLTKDNKVVNIIVPTRTSDITNDSGFISEIPIASKTTLGGFKVGENLIMSADGTLSAVGGDIPATEVIDNLTSTSTTAALSANQRKSTQ